MERGKEKEYGLTVVKGPERLKIPLFEIASCPAWCIHCGASVDMISPTEGAIRICCEEEVEWIDGSWVVITPVEPMVWGRKFRLFDNKGCLKIFNEVAL